jgi:photosystem II stability/assembly factor-like uncharacterized protein
MKTKLYLILFLGLFGADSFPQIWQQLSPYPSAEQSQNMCIYNSAVYASGGNGSLIKTTDSGNNWVYSQINTNGDIICGLSYTSDLIGYAAGYQYSIYKTTNGGTTWTQLERQPTSYKGYWTATFIDANTGFVAGDAGLIKKTTNAGVSWTTVSTGQSFDIHNIVYLGSNILVACGSNQNILRSTNLGSTWSTVDTKSTATKLSLNTYDKTILYIGTALGQIVKSTNAGASWDTLSVRPTNNPIFALYFISNTVGFVADQYGGIFKTTNGGTSWTSSSSGITTTEYFYAIIFKDANTGFVTGANGRLFRTTNGGASWTNQNKGLSGDAYIYSAIFTDQNTGYAGDAYAPKIYKSTNAGVDWTELGESFSGNSVYDMTTPDNSTIYAVTDAPSLYKTTNAGANWSSYDLSSSIPSGHIPNTVHFPSTSTGYVLASNSSTAASIIKTTNGGSNWQVAKNDFSNGLNSCFFTSNNTGHVAGYNGYIATTTNGGTNWITRTSGTAKTLWSIAFYDANTGVACGDSGTFLKTTNGGATWASHNVTTNRALYKVKFMDQFSAVACGESGLIFVSHDAGDTWNDISVATSNNLYTMAINGPYAWVFGDAGAIYKNIGVLPVELSSFTAAHSKSGVLLNWQTETEVNNNKFQIERSSGNNWISVGEVPGHGNSNSPHSYSYIDKVNNPGTYTYRLKQIDNNGTYEYSKVLTVNVQNSIFTFNLAQNYPNPFNPTTTITYQIPEKDFVTLTVYDILGRKVKTLINEKQETGSYSVVFDASKLASGLYIAQLKTNKFSKTIKMNLIK